MSNLYNKYIVEKADGTPVDPEAQYFVLRIDTDPAARHAVLQYAAYIGASDPEFADELRNWVMQRQERNLTKRAPDVCHASSDGLHQWYAGPGSIWKTCAHCGTRR